MRNLIASLVCALLFSACSSDSDTFRLEGRLRNMNQGEFWVYSPDGGMAGIDTIKVREGRFAYELPLADEATLIIVFPNYSEQPVFASPGKTVSIKGDATHLKEMIIQGTKANEDMTSLRMELNDLTPPDIPEAAAAFIEKHPNSPASIYVLDRYLLLTPEPDFKDVLQLTKFLLKAQPENKYLLRLSKELLRLQGAKVGSPMPKFTATDIRGNKVTEAMLRADANVLLTWASWNFQSSGALQQLRMLKKRHGDRLGWQPQQLPPACQPRFHHMANHLRRTYLGFSPTLYLRHRRCSRQCAHRQQGTYRGSQYGRQAAGRTDQ